MELTDSYPTIEYKPKNKPGVKDFKHHHKDGQKKLLVMETLFLKLHGKNAETVVYAGSAPGFHINELIEQFPHIQKWILIDPESTYVLNNKVEIIKDYFTIELSKELCSKYKDILFISDIRSYNKEDKKIPIKLANKTIPIDMELQKRCIEEGNYLYCSVKFRVPWYKGITKYFDGKLYTQPWSGEYSPELRLFTDGKSYRDYDHTKIDNQCYHYNTITRRQIFPELEMYKHKYYDQLLEHNILNDRTDTNIQTSSSTTS